MASKGGLPRRRFAAHEVGPNFSSQRPKSNRVLMERAVHIDDLKNLKFEDRSLYTVFTDRQWTRILQAKGKVYTNIVLEFYQQIYRSSPSWRRSSISYVRGVAVDFSPDAIASFLDLRPVRGKGLKSSNWSANEIYAALTDTNDHVSHPISQKDLVPFFQVLHLIVSTNVTPTEKMEEMSVEQGKFLYDIVRGVDIDLRKHIFQIIKLSAQSFGSSMKLGLPFGQLITGLALKAGVQIKSNEKEQQPMEPISWAQPISQTGPLAYHPLAQQAGTSSANEDHLIRPPWFDAMLMEIDSRVAPIQSQLNDMEDRLQELRDLLIRDTLV